MANVGKKRVMKRKKIVMKRKHYYKGKQEEHTKNERQTLKVDIPTSC